MDTPAPQEADFALIQKILPHRYPFLLVDKVRDIVPGQGAVGLKAVTFNEPHFQGHFPDQPIMPGVLIIEALAQTAAVLVDETSPFPFKAAAYFDHSPIESPLSVGPSSFPLSWRLDAAIG